MITLCTQLLWPNTEIGQIFNRVIVWLTIYGFAAITPRIFRLVKDNAALTKVESSLKAALNTDDTFNPPEFSNLSGLFEFVGLSANESAAQSNTVVVRRVTALWRLRAMGRATVDSINYVQDYKASLGLDIPRYIASALVLVGLSGTVASLHGIIEQINAGFGGNGTAMDSMAQLVSSFAPMKSAFSCTLMGILCSIFLAFAITAIESNEANVSAKLDEIVILYLLPVLFPYSEASQLQKMSELIAKSEASVNSFAATIKESRDFFAETLGDAVRSSAKDLQDSLEAATRALNQSLTDMQVTSAAMSETSESILRYREQLEVERQQVLDYLRDSANQLVRLGETLVAPLAVASQSLLEGRTGVDNLTKATLEGLFELSAALEKIAVRIDATCSTLDSIEASVRSTAVSVVNTSTELESHFVRELQVSAEVYSKVTASVDALLDRLRPELVKLPNGRLIADVLTAAADRLEKISDRTLDNNIYRTESIALEKQINERLERLVQADHSKEVSELTGKEVALLTEVIGLIRTSLADLASIHSLIQQPLWKQVIRVKEAPIHK